MDLKKSSTFLDLYIIDDKHKLHNYGKIPVSFLSAHDLIQITYRIKIERHQPDCSYAETLKILINEIFWPKSEIITGCIL